MKYFTFNGISSAMLGVYLEKEPEIVVGNIRAETQTIIGSAKVLHYTEGDDAMDPIVISLDCNVANATDATINQICAWLRGGGDLVTDYDPNHCYKNAFVSNQIPLTRVFRQLRGYKFTVEFEAEAHRYRLPEAAVITMTTAGLISNPGTAPAEPLIKLTGSGDVDLMIGDSTLEIDGITDYVMIDCAAQIVYRESVNLGTSVTRHGDWPTIPADGCMINWSGTVTELEITPRWRDY